MEEGGFLCQHGVFILTKVGKFGAHEFFQCLGCIGVGAGIVLCGVVLQEGGIGGARMMGEIFFGIADGFLDEGVAAAEVQGRDGCFGRNFFSVLHVIGPLTTPGFAGVGEQELVFFSLLDIEAGLEIGSSFAQLRQVFGQVVDEVGTRQEGAGDVFFFAGGTELLFEPVIVGGVEGDGTNFFCRQLADESGYPAFGLVVFDVGNDMLLFQSLLVVFHRRAVEDDFLLVEVVLGKEEIVFDEEDGCFFIDGEGEIK